MCVNYTPPKRQVFNAFQLPIPDDLTWPAEIWQDYSAPIIRSGPAGDREAILATYGMVPKRHIPPHVKKFTTMNARAETVGQLRSYASAWRAGQLCLHLYPAEKMTAAPAPKPPKVRDQAAEIP